MGYSVSAFSYRYPYLPCPTFINIISDVTKFLLLHTDIHVNESPLIQNAVVSFPLYSEAIKFAHNEEKMIQTAIRALTLRIYHGTVM